MPTLFPKSKLSPYRNGVASKIGTGCEDSVEPPPPTWGIVWHKLYLGFYRWFCHTTWARGFDNADQSKNYSFPWLCCLTMKFILWQFWWKPWCKIFIFSNTSCQTWHIWPMRKHKCCFLGHNMTCCNRRAAFLACVIAKISSDNNSTVIMPIELKRYS